MKKIIVKNVEISFTGIQDNDYWSLTDIARFKNPDDPNAVIANWVRKIDTINFLKLWEVLNNKDLNPPISRGLKVNRVRMPIKTTKEY